MPTNLIYNWQFVVALQTRFPINFSELRWQLNDEFRT